MVRAKAARIAMPPALTLSSLTRVARRSDAADKAGPRPVAASGRARRGPFRPEVWLNARQRHGSRLAAHYFRAADLAAVIGLTLAGIEGASATPLMATPLTQALPFVLGAVTMLGLMKSLSLYRFPRGQNIVAHLGAVVAIVAIAVLAGTVLEALLTGGVASWPAHTAWAAGSATVLVGLHLIWSLLVREWRRNGALIPAIVIVGATRQAERLIQSALDRRDLNVLGVFDDRLARSPDNLAGVPVLGDANALIGHRMTPYVDRIVLAVDPSAQARVRALTEQLRALPNEVTLLVDPKEQGERDEALEKLSRAPLAPLSGVHPDSRSFNKRMQDLVVGSVALVLLAPVMALAALAVRLESPGPIFFRQRRHGFVHEEIVVWKFRTMRHEAADATASRQVTQDDDRITRVGRFLRSTSLDELPQLLNVLKGEMSLVGPRPHAIGMRTGEVESARLVAEYAHRHRIKPGMTGWAAVNGSRGPLHSAADVRRRVQLDVDYIERQSFWLDMWIMAATIPVLLGDRLAVR